MKKSLIVKNNIRIDAPVSRVWEILTKPEYIRQWGMLPEDFGDYDITPATIIEYPDKRLSVVTFNVNQTLKYSLYIPIWEEQVTTIAIPTRSLPMPKAIRGLVLRLRLCHTCRRR